MPTLEQLRSSLEASWSDETCFNTAEWSIKNPARGQCVVTALIVQYYFGGELRKVTTVFQGQPESHYFNLLPDDSEVDFSRQQYPADQVLAPSDVNLHGYASVRAKMLHEPDTLRRYNLLLSRVEARLAER